MSWIRTEYMFRALAKWINDDPNWTLAICEMVSGTFWGFWPQIVKCAGGVRKNVSSKELMVWLHSGCNWNMHSFHSRIQYFKAKKSTTTILLDAQSLLRQPTVWQETRAKQIIFVLSLQWIFSLYTNSHTQTHSHIHTFESITDWASSISISIYIFLSCFILNLLVFDQYWIERWCETQKQNKRMKTNKINKNESLNGSNMDLQLRIRSYTIPITIIIDMANAWNMN